MEQLSNFQFIWGNWIIPLIHSIHDQIDPEFRTSCKLKLRDLTKLGQDAETYYKAKRKELKSEFYGQQYENGGPRRMDFHKLSSIICRTLIEYKVFEFDVDACEKIAATKDITDTDWLVKNALVNFRLAFYASVVFLYQSMLFKYHKSNSLLFKGLRERCSLNLYEESEKEVQTRVHESFENCLVLDLAKRDINNRSFDFFMYSTIMYQLEEYNKTVIMYQIKEKAA